jgi:hypothetical protein
MPAAVVTVGGTSGCATLAPGWVSADESPKRCASVQVMGTGPLELVSRIWRLPSSTKEQEQISGGSLLDDGCVRLMLPVDWLSARVAAVQVATDDSSFVDHTWVVVLRGTTAREAGERAINVWVGRFEGRHGADLALYGGFYCPLLENALQESKENIFKVRIAVLDGPIIAIGWDGNVSLAKAGCPQQDDMLDSIPWDLQRIERSGHILGLGTMMCSANIGFCGSRDALLVLGKIRDENGHAAEALLAIVPVDTTVRVIGAIAALDIPAGEFICDAAFDICTKSVVIACSHGLIFWVNARTARIVHSVALPESAGSPLKVRFGPSSGDLMLTCVAKKSTSAADLLELWALRGRQVDVERSDNIGMCFRTQDWKGMLNLMDFAVLLSDDCAASGEERVDDWLVAVRFGSDSEDNTVAPTFCMERLPWNMIEGSASSIQHAKMQQRLRMRLRAGLRSLVEANIVAEEKRRLVSHLRRILDYVADGGPVPPPKQIFRKSLENVLEGPVQRKRKGQVNPCFQEGQRRLEGRDPGLAVPAVPRRDDKLIRVLRLVHFLDHSGQFLVVALNASVVGSKPFTHATDICAPETAAGPDYIWIELQIADVIDVPWETTEKENAASDRTITFVARVNLSDLVSACQGGLSELRANMRAVCSDGRGQVLGSFSIAPNVLSGGTLMRPGPPEWCTAECGVFSEQATVVARGGALSVIKGLERKWAKRQGGVSVRVHSCESTGLLQVEAPNGITLAASAAEILNRAPDELYFRLAPIAEPRVRTLDASGRVLSEELSATRRYARQQTPTAESFQDLLRGQIQTDEAFGLLEEAFVGVL